MALDGRMKLLLLQCTMGLLSAGVWALPAPINLAVSSFNFRHTLHWTAAPGSPPNSTYHVYATTNVKNWKLVVNSTTLWAEVKLRKIEATYFLYVRSSWNESQSLPSKKIQFTPNLNTIITAPNVTLSGCGKCIQLNISMPKIHTRGRGIRTIYNLEYKVSWRKKLELKAEESNKTKNQTVIIPNLLPGTEYCVQVKPYYLDKPTFLPSPWKCVLTSTVPPSQVLAVVGSVAGLVVFSLSALVLFFFALHYTGIICKLKEALPHPLNTGVWQLSLLRLERTVPEPVSLLPGTGKRQHSDWDEDEDEEDQGTQQVHLTEAQEEDQYMNRCVDLSSDYSSRGGNMTSSCQSAATVSDHPGSQDERIEGNKEEQAQSVNIEDWTEKEESRDCKDTDNWQKLENFESVDLFSVTIPALDVQSDQPLHIPYESDQWQCEAQPLQHTPYESNQGLSDVQPLRHTPYESNQGLSDVQPLRHTPYESNQGLSDVQPLRHTPYESNQGQCDVQPLQHTPYESNQGQCDLQPLRHTPYESNQGLSDVQPLQHTPYESNQGLSDVQPLQHTPYESNQGQCDVQPLQHTPYESNQGQCDLQPLRHTPYESNQGQCDIQPLQHTPYESNQGQCDIQPLQHTPYESNQGQCDVQPLRHTPYESNQGQCDVQPLRHTPYESNQGQCDVQPLGHTPYESNQGQCDIQPLRHTFISSSRTET